MKPSTNQLSNHRFIDKTLFFEVSADLLCIAGFDGFFKDINPAVPSLLGYSRDELLNNPIDSFIHPEDIHITRQYRQNLKDNIPLLNYENRYVTKSGDIVWLSWNSMPHNEQQLVYAIAKNVTHVKLLEIDRSILIANLTRVNRELKQLTYTTSHDLRSPVSNLLSVFDLMDTSMIKDQETIQLLEILRSASESLKDTLNNYVDLLVKNDLLTVSIEELDVEESLGKVRNSLKSLIEKSKTTFHVDLSEARIIKYNRAYLESTFLNLITNSIKYTIPGQAPQIFVSTKKYNGSTQLVYADRGLGFDMDKVKDKIFELNQTFHSHADSKGIGLYLIYNQITNLGGSIAIDSAPNQGAKFTMTFRER